MKFGFKLQQETKIVDPLPVSCIETQVYIRLVIAMLVAAASWNLLGAFTACIAFLLVFFLLSIPKSQIVALPSGRRISGFRATVDRYIHGQNAGTRLLNVGYVACNCDPESREFEEELKELVAFVLDSGDRLQLATAEITVELPKRPERLSDSGIRPFSLLTLPSVLTERPWLLRMCTLFYTLHFQKDAITWRHTNAKPGESLLA